MNLEPTSTVEDILRCCPGTIHVFQGRRMACVGCPMARFDTVEDSARHYGLDPRELLAALIAAVQCTPIPEDP